VGQFAIAATEIELASAAQCEIGQDLLVEGVLDWKIDGFLPVEFVFDDPTAWWIASFTVNGKEQLERPLAADRFDVTSETIQRRMTYSMTARKQRATGGFRCVMSGPVSWTSNRPREQS
jgi:hypothetical protein